MTQPIRRVLLRTRAARGVADGLVAASFAALLSARGLDERILGVVVSTTLLGSATVLLAVARWPSLMSPPRVLLGCGLLMSATGIAFAATGNLAILLPLAVFGPLNPTGGDVSAFMPAEQAMLTERTAASGRSAVFARYSLIGALGATIGGLGAGPVKALGRRIGFHSTDGLALAPLLYAVVGGCVTLGYFNVFRAIEKAPIRDRAVPARLHESKRLVHRLAMLFSLDAAGGGFMGTALIAAWLSRRFQLELGQIGLVLGIASAASAASALAAPRLSRRFGLVETMVFTHLPANALCIAVAFAPNSTLAVSLLVARALLSQLDVPARQTFVMSVVPDAERLAAAAFTNIPRSLAAASTPVMAGWLLHRSTFGWPLIVGGGLKIVYDLLLFSRFRTLSTKA